MSPHPNRCRCNALAGVWALVFVALAIVGCASSTRQKTINATYVVAQTAAVAVNDFSAKHQEDILAAAPDDATAKAQLAAFRQKRALFDKSRAALFEAIAAAAALNNDPSLSAMVAAALTMQQALTDLGVKL